MRTVRFHPEAEAEMVEAAAWYRAQQSDLGSRFLASVQDALNRIGLNPQMYPVLEHDARRCLTRAFPFGVVFRVEADHVVVIAVMHLHRDPRYWKDRRIGDAGPHEG